MTSRPDETTLRQYLAMYQNNPEGTRLSREVVETLQREVDRIWRRMQADSDTYTPSNIEFAVFNALAGQARKNDQKAQKAIQRHWNGRKGRR